MTLTVEYPKDLAQHVGVQLGPSEWITVDQAMIDKFAEATGDHQWIHVDVERAKRDMPGGRTIAHGYLTLGLVIPLWSELLRVEEVGMAVNYGLNRLRFPAPVPVGSRVSLEGKLVKASEVAGGVEVVVDLTMKVGGSEKPALVAEAVYRFYD